MVKNAEAYLGKKINKLIITVPAYFNDSQRKLTKQAAELVQLKVIRVINEPTAAALCYGFDKKQDIKGKILVFDLGGGTFDVSILSLEKEIGDQNKLNFRVLGTSGNTQLGGEDFDNELVNYFLKKRNENENDIRNDKKALKKLKVACENIKKKLSRTEETTLRITNLYKGQDLNEKITRDDFEKQCSHLFSEIENSLDEALIASKMKKGDIDEIILVGGSTKIPKVKQLVKEYFPGCNINDTINPDEAVAYGATLAAEKILYNKDELMTNFHLLDITPLSLGTDIKNNSKDLEIQKKGCEMSIIIKRGTTIPTFGEQTYYSSEDNQTSMSMNIYEGEKKYVKYNHLLKKSNISGLTKRPKGKTKVNVRFDIDINGILIVNAKEEKENNDGQKLNLVIKNDELSLTPEQIKELQLKNKVLLEKMKNNDLAVDITNLKNSLKKYQDAYERTLKIVKEKKKKKKDDDDDDDEDNEEEDNLIIYIKFFFL
jgi:L1 cell adhesion molecule like protein